MRRSSSPRDNRSDRLSGILKYFFECDVSGVAISEEGVSGTRTRLQHNLRRCFHHGSIIREGLRGCRRIQTDRAAGGTEGGIRGREGEAGAAAKDCPGRGRS